MLCIFLYLNYSIFRFHNNTYFSYIFLSSLFLGFFLYSFLLNTSQQAYSLSLFPVKLTVKLSSQLSSLYLHFFLFIHCYTSYQPTHTVFMQITLSYRHAQGQHKLESKRKKFFSLFAKKEVRREIYSLRTFLCFFVFIFIFIGIHLIYLPLNIFFCFQDNIKIITLFRYKISQK